MAQINDKPLNLTMPHMGRNLSKDLDDAWEQRKQALNLAGRFGQGHPPKKQPFPPPPAKKGSKATDTNAVPTDGQPSMPIDNATNKDTMDSVIPHVNPF